jgi:8-amino-7-oxononanoate synthase
MYQKQLKALKRVGRFRERKIFDEDLLDFASNDYLGLANSKKAFKKAFKLVNQYGSFAPKASMLVNGYHPIHKLFEDRLSTLNGFESGLVVGSGFLANLSLIEALTRKGDTLFMDSDYHASGVMASSIIKDRVVFFEHNNPLDLEDKLKSCQSNRKIVAIEGVYSMSGEICDREIFSVADRYNTLLIVDEAHSSGVIGKRLLGVFDYYNISPKDNHIKMGTLGKAYGSYGAYILATSHIISFLENRAKPIIYSTAPSIFDTALALVNINYVSKNYKKLRKKIDRRLEVINRVLDIKSDSLIVPISQNSNSATINLQQKLIKKGFLVGAIRQPTVDKPIIRLIPRLGVKRKKLIKLLRYIDDLS